MYFDTKNYLKSIRNHTAKHALKKNTPRAEEENITYKKHDVKLEDRVMKKMRCKTQKSLP